MAHQHGAPTPCPFESGCLVLRHQGRIPLFTLFVSMFIQIPCRTSDCVERMYVDPINALVQVAFAKGDIYEYTHVSRRAIINLLMNPNMSLGFWVNTNLLPYDCKTRLFGECTTLRALSVSEMPISA
jgi:hypothetical protein